MRYQMVRERAYRNIRAIQRRSKKERYIRGVGEGLIFLFIGGILMFLNAQKVETASIVVALKHLPFWVWMIGGGTALFGLYWTLRNVWLLVSLR